jgi:hypothetical protein
MIIPDVKRAVTTIIARRSPKGEPVSGPAEAKDEKVLTEDGEIDGRHTAAQDLMAAIHEKSPMKIAEALGNFVDLHHLHRIKESQEGQEK